MPVVNERDHCKLALMTDNGTLGCAAVILLLPEVDVEFNIAPLPLSIEDTGAVAEEAEETDAKAGGSEWNADIIAAGGGNDEDALVRAESEYQSINLRHTLVF
jgi:hypothetical protein